MTIRPLALACALAISPALVDAASATGSAIQQERSTAGLPTAGNVGAGTGGTGIYNKRQRRAFGYSRSRNRLTHSN